VKRGTDNAAQYQAFVFNLARTWESIYLLAALATGKNPDSRQVWRLPRREGGEQSPDRIDVLRGPWRRHAKRDHFFALGKLGAHHFDNGFGKRRVCHLFRPGRAHCQNY
jgi:hypothetical protein